MHLVPVFLPFSAMGFLIEGADGGPLDRMTEVLVTSPWSPTELVGILLKPRSPPSLQGDDSHDFWAPPAPQTMLLDPTMLKQNQLLCSCGSVSITCSCGKGFEDTAQVWF